MDGSPHMAIAPNAPKRAPWCALGIAILFIPTARFLSSWYGPYLPESALEPAIDPALTVLGIVALPLVIWLRAGKVRRRRWLWACLSLAGGLLGLVHPLAGVAGGGLPALAYAVTGLTSVTRPTGRRDTETSWILILVGGTLALLLCWFAFNLSYMSDLRLGPPPFMSTPPKYQITLRADMSGLSPESQAGALLASRKTMLLRLKDSSAGVVFARLGRDNNILISLFSTRNQDETVALASSRGALELVDLGENPVPAGSTLGAPHRAIVSGQRLRIVSDWRYDQNLLVRDVSAGYDRNGQPTVFLGFDDEGARLLREFTSANPGKYMGIAVDDVVVGASRVEAPISDGGVAVGGMTSEQARLIALKLKFGELAVPFSVDRVEATTPTGR